MNDERLTPEQREFIKKLTEQQFVLQLNGVQLTFIAGLFYSGIEQSTRSKLIESRELHLAVPLGDLGLDAFKAIGIDCVQIIESAISPIIQMSKE